VRLGWRSVPSPGNRGLVSPQGNATYKYDAGARGDDGDGVRNLGLGNGVHMRRGAR
jgi:hypothetical protein